MRKKIGKALYYYWPLLLMVAIQTTSVIHGSVRLWWQWLLFAVVDLVCLGFNTAMLVMNNRLEREIARTNELRRQILEEIAKRSNGREI